LTISKLFKQVLKDKTGLQTLRNVHENDQVRSESERTNALEEKEEKFYDTAKFLFQNLKNLCNLHNMFVIPLIIMWSLVMRILLKEKN